MYGYAHYVLTLFHVVIRTHAMGPGRVGQKRSWPLFTLPGFARWGAERWHGLCKGATSAPVHRRPGPALPTARAGCLPAPWAHPGHAGLLAGGRGSLSGVLAVCSRGRVCHRHERSLSPDSEEVNAACLDPPLTS